MAKTGTDFLLESLLRLAGVDVESAKGQILSLGRKFHEQDALLHRIENNQKAIMQHFGIVAEPLFADGQTPPQIENIQLARSNSGG